MFAISQSKGPERFPWWYTTGPVVIESMHADFQFAISVACLLLSCLGVFTNLSGHDKEGELLSGVRDAYRRESVSGCPAISAEDRSLSVVRWEGLPYHRRLQCRHLRSKDGYASS